MKLSFRLAAAAGIVTTGLAFTVPALAAASARPRTAVWTATFASPQAGTGATPAAEAVSPDGTSLYVVGAAGNSQSNGPRNWETIAYGTGTGKVRWRHSFRGTETTYPFSFPGSVTVSPDGSTVFVSGLVTNKKQTGEQAVVAYSAATGARLWSYEAAPVGSAVYSAVSPDGSTLYVVTDGFSAFALSTATGKLLWTSSLTFIGSDHPSFGGAMSADGTQLVITGFYNGGGGLMTADLNTSTGAARWTRFYPGASSISDAPAVVVSPDGSNVFLSSQNVVIDYNSTNGLIRWSETAHVGSSLVVSPDGSTVYTAGIGSSGFDLSALSATSGAMDWTASVGAFQPQSPVLAESPSGSSLYLGGAGVLRAFSASAGAPLWQTVQVAGPVAAVVSPNGSRVFVTGGTLPFYQSEFVTSAFRA